MTRDEIIFALNTMSKSLRFGDIEQLSEFFVTPIPFYEDNGLALLKDREEVAAAIRKYYDETKAEGTVRFVPELIAIEESSQNRSLCLVKWNHYGANGKVLSYHAARYSFSSGDTLGAFTIELVECGHSVLTRSCIPKNVLHAG